MGRPDAIIKPISAPINYSRPGQITPPIEKSQPVVYGDNIGLDGKIIENYAEKIRAASVDPFVLYILESTAPMEVSDTLKYYAQNPRIDMIRRNPELFLFSSRTSDKKLNIEERYSDCRFREDVMNLIIDANTIEDCNYIINKLSNQKGKDGIEMKEIAKIKVNFLTEQLQKESIEKKVAEAGKAYVAPQIYSTQK